MCKLQEQFYWPNQSLTLTKKRTRQEIYEKNVNMHNILDRKILHTEEGLCKYQSSTKDIMKKAEEISSSNDSVQWQQVKAKLIHTTEKAQQLKYQEMMEQYAKRISGKEEPPKEVKEISPQIMETIQKRKMKINEMKTSLVKALNQKKYARQMLADQVAKSERENLVLQKRNNALLLRLKRQLQESQYQHSHAQSYLQTLQQNFQQKSSKLAEQRAKYSQ
ncbi:rho-associated protein kinase 1 isoform X2 [Anabrus simplex]|uniref:rho-associated protein kinase 1 isoform X2 n=1 Tax=Anabrus simplex TaxID=316456 RepID=UPI0034DD003D